MVILQSSAQSTTAAILIMSRDLISIFQKIRTVEGYIYIIVISIKPFFLIKEFKYPSHLSLPIVQIRSIALAHSCRVYPQFAFPVFLFVCIQSLVRSHFYVTWDEINPTRVQFSANHH